MSGGSDNKMKRWQVCHDIDMFRMEETMSALRDEKETVQVQRHSAVSSDLVDSVRFEGLQRFQSRKLRNFLQGFIGFKVCSAEQDVKC